MKAKEERQEKRLEMMAIIWFSLAIITIIIGLIYELIIFF